MSGGYEVEAEALDKAAAAYQAQGRVVRELLARFTTDAKVPAKAFGALPQSAQLAGQYATFFDNVTGDLGTLAGSLAGGESRLGATAANYRSAEAASIVR
jgi:hypothetical protein